VIGDIELFCRERAKSGAKCPLVAITGTNGKSTTTALTAHLLQSAGVDAQMGGNIGVPVLALAPFKADRAYVLEVFVLSDRSGAFAERDRRHPAKCHGRSSRSSRHDGALRCNQGTACRRCREEWHGCHRY
jgi:hypothetical protein